MIETRSVCPICYKEIKAIISINGTVVMNKACPEHGYFASLVEKDPAWYMFCRSMACKEFYPGYMLDVTNKCNLACKYCYHDNAGGHRSVSDIMAEVKENIRYAPFFLTGGEPTVHPQLFEILENMKGIETYILTNGIKLSDPEYLKKVCERGIRYGNILAIALSFHEESKGKDIEFIELCKTLGYKMASSFYVIDELSQIDTALNLAELYKDVLLSIRIKAASNLWGESRADNKIFTSDMVKYMEGKGAKIDTRFNIKNSFAPMTYRGLRIMLVSWYDKRNVDLDDINCAPWYRANDGSINNLVTTGIVNEGLVCIK